MSKAVTIAIAKTNVGEIHIHSHGSAEYAFLTFYREASSEPLTMAEIGHVVEVALDEFSFGAVDNDYNLGQGDIEHGHFLQMVMKLQAELFQQKYETLN